MAVRGTILSRLAGKQTELNNGVQSARVRAKNLEEQITDLHVSAAADEKKSAAIGEALAILNTAGVEV